MAQWLLETRIRIVGIGPLNADRTIQMAVEANSLEEACRVVKVGLVTVQVLGGKAVDKTDGTITVDGV